MTDQKGSQPPTKLAMFGSGGRPTGESAKDPRTTLRRLLDYLKPYRQRLIVVAVLVVSGTLGSLAGPILLGQAIDRFIATGDTSGLRWTVMLMLAVYLLAGATTIGQGLVMVGLAQRFVADIRTSLFNHLQTLSMAYHDQHRVGDVMSRISNDAEAINQALSNGLTDFTANVLLLGGIMIAMFFLNWQLAGVTLILLPLMLFITSQITHRSRGAFRDVQRNLGTLNAVMEENIAGIRAVKAFAREKDTLAEFMVVNAANRQAGIKADVITAALGPMFTTMGTLTIAVTAWVGGWLAIRGIVSVGVLATFIIYIMNFFRPMRTIAMVYNQLQSALAGAERIFVVLDKQPSVQDRPNARPLPRIRGEVVFDRVSFEYEPDKPVLIDISLTASSGQVMALVGPTGAGKTTIISLLSRFYDVTGGTISVDGQDIRAIRQDSLRAQLGIVLQDTFLFSDTVLENIRYGRLDATEEEVRAAAKLANADHFIRLLPQGYQTQLSEQGHNFSQGQRQLLAIARAILADPRILILDEATSSVDTRTELQLQEALLRLMAGRTSFVIAHRLSTIRQADQVLVINDHRIIERGTHDELLALGGFYHELYMSQYRRAEALLGTGT